MSRILKILIIPAAAFGSTALLVFILSPDPAGVLYYFFTSPFANKFNFGNMINHAALLMLSATGIALVFKAGMFNLGGEGQIYTGAFVSTAAALAAASSGVPAALAIALAAAAGSLSGGAMGSLSGYLKMKWNTNELISSFLLSAGAIHVVNYMITGPMSDPESFLITTREIPEALRFVQLLPPSKLNISFFTALAAAALCFIYLYRTAWGLKHRICGKNIVFAYYSGISTGSYVLLPFLASGALNGFAGSAAAMGTYYMCAYNSTAGLGWSAIAVSLIGRNHPLLIIPSAFFIAFLESGLSGITLYTGFAYELSPLLQALIFFFITTRLITNGGGGVRRYI